VNCARVHKNVGQHYSKAFSSCSTLSRRTVKCLLKRISCLTQNNVIITKTDDAVHRVIVRPCIVFYCVTVPPCSLLFIIIITSSELSSKSLFPYYSHGLSGPVAVISGF
jgi:hypothetical protein